MPMMSAEPPVTELSDYVAALKRRKLIVLVVTLLGLAAGAAFATLKSPSYTSTAKVLVTPRARLASAASLISMSTEQEVVHSDAVARLAASSLGLDDPD